MKYRYKFLSIISIITIIATIIPTSVFAENAPDITAPNAILIDYETGKVLFDKNGHVPAQPASTTKIMTAILTLENANLNDRIHLDYQPNVDGSSMFLLEGESFTVEELLKALLIRSANDSAEVLAVHIAGSVEDFVVMMNKRAKELGALKTNFVNPHGLPDPDHITTAHDLALMAKHAMTFDVFRDIVSTPMLTLEATKETPEDRIYRNTNKFLWATGRANTMLYEGEYVEYKYDIIDGIKTGYTSKSKHCLVSTGVKDGYRVISVILGAEGERELYGDTRSLIDYGHNNFKLVKLFVRDSSKLSVGVENGRKESLDLVGKNEKYVVLATNRDTDDLVESISIDEDIRAPISRGQILGRVTYFSDNEPIAEIDLIAKDNIEEKSLLFQIRPLKILIILIVFLVVWKIFIAFLRFRKKRRRGFVYRKKSSVYSFHRNLLK